MVDREVVATRGRNLNKDNEDIKMRAKINIIRSLKKK